MCVYLLVYLCVLSVGFISLRVCLFVCLFYLCVREKERFEFFFKCYLFYSGCSCGDLSPDATNVNLSHNRSQLMQIISVVGLPNQDAIIQEWGDSAYEKVENIPPTNPQVI